MQTGQLDSKESVFHQPVKRIFRHALICVLRVFVEPLTVIRDLRGALVSGNERLRTKIRERRRAKLNAVNADAIFVWIPKSAGTSVFGALEQKGAQKLLSVEAIRTLFKHRGIVTFGHIYVPALLEEGLLTEDFFLRSYKFTIVRNPFDRVVSLFEYLRSGRWLPKTTTFEIFSRYLEEGAWEDIGLINHDGLSQLSPQVKWITDESGKIFVDQIYRFEDLANCWPSIWHKLGVNGPTPQLAALNRSQRGPVSDYFSNRTIEVVQKVYAEDFTVLDYSAEPAW